MGSRLLFVVGCYGWLVVICGQLLWVVGCYCCVVGCYGWLVVTGGWLLWVAGMAVSWPTISRRRVMS